MKTEGLHVVRTHATGLGPASTASSHRLNLNDGEHGASSGHASHHDDEDAHHSMRFQVCSLQMNQTQPLTSSVSASISISSES